MRRGRLLPRGMAGMIEKVAEMLGISVEEAKAKGALALLRERRRACMLERLEILRRYRAKSASDLEAMIREGKVEEHPGWEDLILLENIEEEIRRIDKAIEDLSANFEQGEK